MRFGICTTFDKIGLLEKLGYDYLEASIQSIAFLSDGEFEQVKERIDASKLKVEAFNVLLPGDLKVVRRTRAGWWIICAARLPGPRHWGPR